MKKRRIFDIDLPEEPETFPAGKEEAAPSRRSPMAAAITENKESLRDRRAVEDQIRAENDALAEEHVRLKRLGLIVDMVPIAQIDSWKLVRDRARGDDMELAELIASLRDIGLSNPIRVEERGDGRYELVQGFRRLAAYRQLLEETGDEEKWGRIPAGILPRGEDLDTLYRRMVDENLVRKDISFAEMAVLALNYARDPETPENDPDKAVAILFQSAGYQKRSYIRQFVRLMDRLADDLRFAQHIPRALGLKLASALEDRPELLARIRADLEGWDNRSVSDEIGVLQKALGGAGGEPEEEPSSGSDVPAKAAGTGRVKTTFQVSSQAGRAKCLVTNGRLEIRLERDFTAIDRRKLEAALARMLDDLA